MTESPTSLQPSWRSRLQRLRVPFGFLAAVLFVAGAAPSRRSLSIGVPIALLGLLIRAWASGHLRKNAELAVSGPYAHTRNPLYFGSFVMAVGCAISGGALWTGLLLAGFFLLVYLPVMKAEAEHMQTLFARDYAVWAEHVPLFFPRLRPYAAAAKRAFDWGQYRKHREYRAFFGWLVVMAILLLKTAWQARGLRALALCGALLNCAAAQSVQIAPLKRDFKPPLPIPAGERLEYEVRFARFPIYATVGTVTFTFLGPVASENARTLIAGLPIEFTPSPEESFYHFRGEAVSRGILIAILGIDVKDRFETLIDTRDLAARLSFKEIKEGKKHNAQASLFDREQNTVKFTQKDLNQSTPALKESTKERKDGMLDLISAFYFVRLQKLKTGQSLQFPVSDDAGSYNFEIFIGKTEKLKTDCGKVKTIRVEPKLFGPGRIFSRQGEMTMWVTADRLHIPVRLLAKTPSGTVSAKITNFKNSCKIIEPDPADPAQKQDPESKS